MKSSFCKLCIIIVIIFSTVISASVKNIKYNFNPCSISRKNLLKSSLLSWKEEKVLFSEQSYNHETSKNDTITILAFMVEFIQHDDSLTTGDGTFMLTVEDPVVDPPPHNQTYFKNQLTALSSYYKSVSAGKLVLTGTVFPEILKLNNTMGYYNSEESENGIDKGLVELFRDAIQAADVAGALFSHYDSYIIFHAGVGNDFAFDYDPTPHDISSAFLDLDKLRRYLAQGDPNFQGIEVENSSFPVQEGIILPETQNQEDGQYFYEIGLLGTMSIMYGFQLGLPALWNTETGRSGIGMWGLMDQGSGNYMGLIPAEPCAFSKVLLGWETPIIITQQNNVKIACSRSVESHKIYKVPINDHEYFLIENRQYDTNGDSVTTGRTSSGAQVIFRGDGTINMEKNGVITSVEEYDYGLPGSGILIWHIDEKVIRSTIEDNRINADKNQRGVQNL
ncbi:MAG: hypothetical protein P8078_08005 [bacterium]